MPTVQYLFMLTASVHISIPLFILEFVSSSHSAYICSFTVVASSHISIHDGVNRKAYYESFSMLIVSSCI